VDEDKAFDAVESYLCETQTEPGTEWRTVSLVTAMLGIVSHGPEFQRPTPEARRDAFKAAADELTRRGLDGLALVRYGMRAEVVAPLLSGLLVSLAFGGSIQAHDGIDVSRWCALLDLEPPVQNPVKEGIPAQWFEEVLMPSIPRLNQWVASASLDDLVALSPPEAATLPMPPVVDAPDRIIREQYCWAVDHFAKTYLRDWRTASLHYELRWMDGDLLPPCPNELMQDRRISRQEITEEIAKRVVYNQEGDPGQSLAMEMSRHALKLLRQGRCREAAAVFEFGVQQRPEDPEVRNNLGFCLVPIEPREALDHLRASANMGYTPSATNTYNQMCCYVAIGRSRAALNVADMEFQNSPHLAKEVLLWRQASDGTWEIVESDNPFQSVAELAVEIARIEGWKEQEQHWLAIGRQALDPTAVARKEESDNARPGG
jgi:hypothetical protein